MKLMTSDQMLALVPSTRADQERAAAQFPSVLAASFLPNYYHAAFAEGWVTPTSVVHNGEVVGLVGWHRSCDGGLFVDCAIKFTESMCDELMWRAFRLLEEQERPRYTRFLTMRRGMAVLAAAHGFAPVAVLMQKT